MYRRLSLWWKLSNTLINSINMSSTKSSYLILWCICSVGGVVFAKFTDENLSPYELGSCEDDCNSSIYCKGKVIGDAGIVETSLLHMVQMLEVYDDGIKFVQKEMKFRETDILKNFTKLKKQLLINKHNITKEILKTFVDANFEDEFLEKVRPTDFKNNPAILSKVNGPARQWLSELNKLWVEFARRIPKEKMNSSNSSLIYVPKTFIIAGFRFKEMYYWDSYWIIKGLLACEMYETSRDIIENMIYLVQTLGHVPNGNRVFYTKRSQPPMLIQMADIYYKATNDQTFIKNNLKSLTKEFVWWCNNRLVNVEVNGKYYRMFHYNAISCQPRPESYKKDFDLMNTTEPLSMEDKKRIYTAIRSGAESGWDFTSRHMNNPENAEDESFGLRDMNLQHFAYVDLNTMMYLNAKKLAEWEREFGRERNAEHLDRFAQKLLDTIENVMWDQDEGTWLDFDMEKKQRRNYFYASNLVPLWGKVYGDNTKKVDQAVDYLIKNEIIFENLTAKYCGVPVSAKSMNSSKQQWDFPNVWAPYQSFIVQGLQESNNSRAQTVAFNLASAYVSSLYKNYTGSGEDRYMYEKYDAEHFGKTGGKGEYLVVQGFGWTNGLVLDLFSMWNNLTINSTCGII